MGDTESLRQERGEAQAMKATILSDLSSTHRRDELGRRGPLEFRLLAPLVVEVDGVKYRAPIGAKTDGASTPRFFRSLVPRIGPHIYGAIIHDAAYRGVLEYLQSGLECANHPWWRPAAPTVTREWADHAFLAVMEAANTGWLTRTMAFYAVRLFGRRAFKGGKA